MDNKFLKKCAVCLCVFSFSPLFAQSFQGKVTKIVIDNFKNQSASVNYLLKTPAKTYELNIPKEVLKITPLNTGDQITIDGDLLLEGKANSIHVKSIIVDKHAERVPVPKYTSQYRILALLVNFTDQKTTNSTTQASIGQQLYTNTNSLSRNYVASTANQIQFIPSPDSSGNPGVYTVSLNYALGTSCNYLQWEADALNAATQQGINVNAFTHRLMIVPFVVGNNCGWAGLGYLGCGTLCDAWVIALSDDTGVMAHELGHNVGMHHANSNLNNSGNIVEYGDQSDAMGTGANRLINAPHRDILQLFQAYPGKISTITQSGQYILNSLDADPGALQILKIKKKTPNGGFYYLSYRTNQPPFGMGAPYLNTVNVHYTNPGDAHSYYVTALSPSQSFVDATNGVQVTVLSSFLDCGVILNVTLT